MRKFRVILVALALSTGAIAAAPTMAQASSGSISIHTIASPKVSKGHKATIRPSVSAKGQVAVRSKTLTVYQGKKKIVNNKTSASLGVGSYKVTTTVKYQTYSHQTAYKNVTTHPTAVKVNTSAATSCRVNSVATHVVSTHHVYVASLTCSSATKKYDTVTLSSVGFVTATKSHIDTINSFASSIGLPKLPAGSADWVGGAYKGTLNPLQLDPKYYVTLKGTLASGKTLSGQIEPLAAPMTKTTTTKVKYTKTVWSSTKTATKTQSLSVKKR